jgi:hypothetical protein
MHLLIPFACSTDAQCLQALEPLQLPHLEKLLRRLAPAQTDGGPATSLTPPHERVLAQSLGLAAPDGCIPWAAHQAALAGRETGTAAWAWITPVHWDVGADHITMADPGALDLQEVQSRELLLAMQPFFDEDGITLDYAAAHRWLAQGRIFADLASASLDRVAGREISPWMSTAAPLRRLQNEMQMLLYTNPLNDARTARGLATVNSFWVSGTGSLPQPRPSGAPDVTVADTLRAAALRKDWSQWARNWVALDQTECRSLLESADSGKRAQLTLCGERNALRFESPQDGALARLRRRFTRTTLQGLQEQL